MFCGDAYVFQMRTPFFTVHCLINMFFWKFCNFKIILQWGFWGLAFALWEVSWFLVTFKSCLYMDHFRHYLKLFEYPITSGVWYYFFVTLILCITFPSLSSINTRTLETGGNSFSNKLSLQTYIRYTGKGIIHHSYHFNFQ